MIELMQEDFPAPVAPEMRMCGISARFDMTARPRCGADDRWQARRLDVRLGLGLGDGQLGLFVLGQRLGRRLYDSDPFGLGDRLLFELFVVVLFVLQHPGVPPRGQGCSHSAGADPHAAAERGQRDSGGEETPDEDHRDEENGGPGGADPGTEGMTDQHPDPAAGVAQLLRLVEGGVAVGQLPEPGEPDYAEKGAQSGSERFGAFPFEKQHDGRADADQRDDDPHPADEVGEAGVDMVADGPQSAAPQGQGQEDTQRDQTDRPEVGGVPLEDRRFRRRRGRSFPGSLVRAAGRALPCRGAGRGRSALRRHHSDKEISAARGNSGGHSAPCEAATAA